MALKPEDEAAVAGMKRDAVRRTARVLVGAGAVLLAIGLGLLVLGVTYEEPAERIATRSVPDGAETALIIAGAVVALGGVALVVQAIRGMRGKEV